MGRYKKESGYPLKITFFSRFIIYTSVSFEMKIMIQLCFFINVFRNCRGINLKTIFTAIRKGKFHMK